MSNQLSKIPKKEELSQWFCIAPWTHTFISPQSERRLCCASQEQATWQRQAIDSKAIPIKVEYDPETLEQHWNSEKMKDIRRRILAGEKIPECAVCNNSILNLHTYKKFFTENLFKHKIDLALENTSLDGSTSLMPASYDYRVSNLCNFKCRMCGEQLSSSWEAEKRTNGFDLSNQLWLKEENKAKIENFQKNVVEEELWAAAKNGELEEIYWVGGEPLMYEIHWKLMKYLVDSGQAKNVIVRYNTNLSRTSAFGLNLYDLLPHFKKVNVCASIDGIGENVEYIRSGISWNSWLENFKAGLFLNELFGKDAMVLDVTITLPGLYSMMDLIDLALELEVKSYVKVCFDFSSSAFMSPLALPKKILTKLCDQIIAYETVVGSELTEVYSDTFRSLRERQTFEEKYPDYKEGLAKGKEFCLKLEKIRKCSTSMRDIFKKDSQALAWWDQIGS